jgi:hypothetical protein
MTVKNSLKNHKQLSIASLLAFGSCLLISASAIAPVVYGAFPSGEITNAENAVKADISHEQAVVKAAEEKFPTPATP